MPTLGVPRALCLAPASASQLPKALEFAFREQTLWCAIGLGFSPSQPLPHPTPAKPFDAFEQGLLDLKEDVNHLIISCRF